MPKKPPPRKKGNGAGKSAGEMIPLSRWRAALARARTSRRADALLELPDAARTIPTLPAQELYYVIKEVGLAESGDLLTLVSPAQVRSFVDLDAWTGDRIEVERLAEWIDALVDLGPEKLGPAV